MGAAADTFEFHLELSNERRKRVVLVLNQVIIFFRILLVFKYYNAIRWCGLQNMEAHDNDKISHLNFSGFGTHSIHAWISLESTQGLHTCQSLFRNFFAHCTILLFTALSTISRAPSGSEFWNSNQSRFGNCKFWETKSSCKSRFTVGRQKDSRFVFNYKIGQQNAASLVVGLCYRSLHPAGLELFWILSATIFRFLISLSCTT